MDRRLDETQITSYVLNEMKPEERLFVEAMMFGCEKTRADALAMMEMAQMLEEGLGAELAGRDLQLDGRRRELILAAQQTSFWELVGRVSATAVSLAACVAFSVAAPVISRLALNTEPGRAQLGMRSGAQGQQGTGQELVDVIDPGAFPSVVVDGGDSVGSGGNSNAPAVDEFPTRILLPTGTVNFVEMPMPVLGGELD